MIPVFALSTVATALLGVAVVVVVFILYGIGTFNTLVALRNRYKNAFSQIDVQLKRRYDLIPESRGSRQGVYESRARDAGGGDSRAESGGDGAAEGGDGPG